MQRHIGNETTLEDDYISGSGSHIWLHQNE